MNKRPTNNLPRYPNYIRLTYDIFDVQGLNSTDQIVLSYRLNFKTKPFFQKPRTVAENLRKPKKTVEKSISKLKRMGYWPTSGIPLGEGCLTTQGGDSPTQGGSSPSGGGGAPTQGGGAPTGGGDKNPVSPLKTGALLDTSLDSLLDNQLEEDKKDILESAAGASPLCHQPQAFFKSLEEDSVPKETQETRISDPTGSEAPIEDRHPSIALVVPLGADGKPLNEYVMRYANLAAYRNNKPKPYTEEQILAATIRDSVKAPFGGVLEQTTDCHRKSAEEQIENIVEKRAG